MKKFFLHLFAAIIFLASIPLGLIVFFSIFGNPLGVSDKELISKANEFAISQAVEFQMTLDNVGRCPDSLELWDSPVFPEEYQFQKNIENSRESIPVRYSCEEDLTFDIWVRYSIDSDLTIKGGKGSELKIIYGHFSDQKNLVIDVSMDKDKLQKLLIREKLITSISS